MESKSPNGQWRFASKQAIRSPCQPSDRHGHGNGHANGGNGEKPFQFRLQEDAPPCHECGSIMVRGGACYKCLNCGNSITSPD